MSDKEDKTDQQQQPADQESRRARSVPRPNMGVFSGERGLSRAVPAMPVQPTSSERTRHDIHTFPFSLVPTRDEITAQGVHTTAVPSTSTRSPTPGLTYTPRQSLPILPTPFVSPGSSASAIPGSSPDSGRAATARGGPPPYWQHIGEPSMPCTPPRVMNNFPSVGRRTKLPLPPIRDIFSPESDGPQNERVDLPPLFMSPSVFCHMRDADPASAVDTQTGPRFESKSPDLSRSHGSRGGPQPGRERTHEGSASSTPNPTPTPTPSAPARAIHARQVASSPEKARSEVKMPDSSAQLTNFKIVEAHTAKCDLCNKRNTQGMTRCVECGWQTCNACTIKNNCFRSHRVGNVVHIGPIDKKDLPNTASVKKAKQAAKRKREDPDYVPESERGSKKKRATNTQVRTTDYTSMPFSSLDGSPNEGDSLDMSDRATVHAILAARTLCALSLEAFEMDARARACSWHHGSSVRRDAASRNEGDETELENPDEAQGLFDRCIPRLRQEALKVASKEAHYYVREEMRKLNPSMSWHESSESESENEPNDGRVKTRAQTYARKRPAY